MLSDDTTVAADRARSLAAASNTPTIPNQTHAGASSQLMAMKARMPEQDPAMSSV